MHRSSRFGLLSLALALASFGMTDLPRVRMAVAPKPRRVVFATRRAARSGVASARRRRNLTPSRQARKARTRRMRQR